MATKYINHMQKYKLIKLSFFYCLFPFFIHAMDQHDVEQALLNTQRQAIRYINRNYLAQRFILSALGAATGTIIIVLTLPKESFQSHGITCLTSSNASVENTCSRAQLATTCSQMPLTPCQHTPENIKTAQQLVNLTQEQFKVIGGVKCIKLVGCKNITCDDPKNEALNVNSYIKSIQRKCFNTTRDPHPLKNAKLQRIRAQSYNYSKRGR